MTKKGYRPTKGRGELALSTLREENSVLSANLELLNERLAELELAQEDEGWMRLSGDSDREFSREGLARIMAQSRLFYLKSPVINRSVNVQAYYVFAQGINIQAADEAVNEVVQAFLDDPANDVELTSHQARMLKEIDLQVLGNIFFVFFINKADGTVRLRSIPPEEVQDIITNPEDAKEPWYYKRVWQERGVDGVARSRTAYYPDWRAPSGATPPAGAEVREEPVYHVKVGALSDMRFGLPETYQSLDWAKAYKAFLEDRATIARALSRFAWRVTAPGGAKGIATAKTKLATTVGATGETNPPPVTGAAFVRSQGGADLDPIKTTGATINPEEGRRFLLMAAMGFGLPETFYGDVSVGTLATAKAMDRPTQLKFLDRRTLWADIHLQIVQFVIDWAIRARRLLVGVDRHVDISFPDLLEEDVTARVSAVIDAATLKGQTPAGTMDDRTLVRLLLQALGVDQIDELLDVVAPQDGESLMAQMRADKAAMAQAIAQRVQPQDGENGQDEDEEGQSTTEAMMVEAVRELREALKGVIGNQTA